MMAFLRKAGRGFEEAPWPVHAFVALWMIGILVYASCH